MLPISRGRTPKLLLSIHPAIRRSYSVDPPSVARTPASNPNAGPPVPNVSETNALPTSSEGSQDRVLQESPDVAEERRVMQAPNRKETWSRSQMPRALAMVGPRFEQTIMEDQVWRQRMAIRIRCFYNY